MSNQPLNRAIREKNDEFYTLLPTIENELQYYKDCFKDKMVLLNCDNWQTSNFYKYFKEHFDELGLRSLVAVDYLTGNTAGIFDDGSIYERVRTGKPKEFSYDSEATKEIFDRADIIVTNPPFSKARAFLNYLLDNDKQFLVLFNLNTMCTHDLFPSFMNGEFWLGRTIHNGDVVFEVPPDYETHSKTSFIRGGKKYLHVNTVRWLTNIGEPHYPDPLTLTKHYTPEEYPKYDNLDAINCDVTKDIPMDYDGCIGVPITFLDKYNPSQFEIVGKEIDCGRRKVKINGHEKYNRIIIKHK